MNQETILLTGATGNVGAVTLDQILKNTTHKAIAVIRKDTYIPQFKEQYPAETSNGRLTFSIIPDLAAPGAFDAPASSATAIMHIATPIASDHWVDNLINPTWMIDHQVLEAAKKSPSIKRVIICGTILQTLSFHKLNDPNVVISEDSWNEITFEQARDGPFFPAYACAKTLAEKKTWEWVEQNRDAGFDVVMLLPGNITGRSPQITFKPVGGPGGIPNIYHSVMVSKKAEDVDQVVPFLIDNDDVARTHIESLDRFKVPGNQRYLVVRPEPHSIREFAARFRAEHPELAHRVADLPPLETEPPVLCQLDVSKGDRTFGMQWVDWYESTSKIIFDVLAWEEKHGGAGRV